MQQSCSEYGDTCSTIVHQTVDVGLPISLAPLVQLGGVKVMYSEEPRVECCNCTNGGGGLELRITQTITYKIPIAYSAEATAGAVTSECKRSMPGAGCTQCRH